MSRLVLVVLLAVGCGGQSASANGYWWYGYDAGGLRYRCEYRFFIRDVYCNRDTLPLVPGARP